MDRSKGSDPREAGLDPEEARIFRQSIPKEAVTRDFLQELLDEHRATSRRAVKAPANIAGCESPN